MRTTTVAAITLALTLGGPAAPTTAATASPSAPHIVHIKDFGFRPTVLRVHAGELVRFVNDDAEAHTVTATDRTFDSEGLDTGQSWDHVFKTAGTFAYFCELHPYMKATVEVSG